MSVSPGNDATTVFERTLTRFGHRITSGALVEACGGDLSLRSFARCAQEHGLEATLVNLHPGDLEYVRMGTIVELEDGTMVSVLDHDPRGVKVERGDGTIGWLTVGDELAPVRALSLSMPVPPQKFLARLFTRMSDELHVGRAVALALLLSVMLAGLGVAGPLLVKLVFASALPDRAPSQLTLLAGGIVLIGAQVTYVGWLRRSALLYLLTKLSERSTTDLVSHLLRLPLSRLRAYDLGELSQTITAAAAAAEAIPATLAPHFVDAVLGLGFLVLVFVFDPRSGVVVAGFAGLVIVGGYFVGRQRRTKKQTLLLRRGEQQRILHETFAGIETVKVESAEGKMLDRWIERLIRDEEAALSLQLQRSSLEVAVDVMEKAGFAAVLLLLSTRCLDGSASIADLVAALQASAGFMFAAVMLARLPSELAEYRVDVERVDPLLEEPTEGDLGGRLPNTTRPALALRDVWFRYDEDSPWVVLGANLVIHHGERVILSWPSGAGKSTLLRILSGLVPPTRGDMLVFGRDAARARRMVTYVPQQATVFGGSIIDNLRMLSGNAPFERLIMAAEATGLLAMVSEWPMGIETWVFGGSSSLSSGQCQLVILTAAVASEAPIVILDEALAHMDLEMRARLEAADLFRGRTVVSVLHDASAAEAAGARVVKMEELVGAQAHDHRLSA